VATYSTLDDADKAALARAYDLDLGATAPIEGGMANSSFLADTPRGKVVISILDNQDDAAALRLAETNVHMRARGIPTSEVIPRADGGLVTRIKAKSVLLRWWLDGQCEDSIPDGLLPQAAGLLARIHDCDPSGLDIPVGTRRLGPAHRAMLDDFPNQEHAQWVRRRLHRLDIAFPPAEDPRRGSWTIVHGDFNAPNIVIGRTGHLSVIDWETATIDDPMLDCGMSMISTCRTGNGLDESRALLFLDGYRSSGRPVEPELLRAGIEYAAVIVAFHRYRRHHIRFPNPARADYYKLMVDFVEQEFPEAAA
jgi:homoserine kinase type II